jgi:hypothetical protein
MDMKWLSNTVLKKMKFAKIKLAALTPDHLEVNWLWQFVPAGSDGDLLLKPVKVRQTQQFTGRLAACKVRLADGSAVWGLIEGLDLATPEFLRHNRELYLWTGASGWFHLAQYFDSNAIKAIQGPEVLCGVLGKPLDQIFPIQFDLSARSTVESTCLHGSFEVEPAWGLSQADVMAVLVREL